MTVFDKIEQLRKERRLPKGIFYSSIGVTATGYSKMISNNDLKLSTLEKVSGVLGVPIGYFFGAEIGVGEQGLRQEISNLQSILLQTQKELIEKMKEIEALTAQKKII